LILREDNADLRLTETARELGLIDDAHWQAFATKREAIAKEQQRLNETLIKPNSDFGKALSAKCEKPLAHEYKASDILRRPEIDYAALTAIIGEAAISEAAKEQVEIQAKYFGYLDRQLNEIEKAKRNESTPITKISDYKNVRGLSAEVCQKLNDHKPETIGQASRIPGITPVAISLLMVHLKKSVG
jgi:tRNA uridine 5-carboxymethylaminomethyl modification enzyme